MIKTDVYKAGGIIIRDRKLLAVRSKDKDHFVIPGGKLEKDETPENALIRELKEEINITVMLEDFHPFGIFFGRSAGNQNHSIRMDVFFVKHWLGIPQSQNEIEELLWLSSDLPKDKKFGSIFEQEIIPRLKKQQLID